MVSTIIISIVLLAIVVSIIRGMHMDKKNGESSCGCGCSGCTNSGTCHPHSK